MKKVLLTMLFVIVVAFAFYGTADAISGVCSGCHTMHDSQDGNAVASGGPNDILLKDDCLGCHTDTGSVGPRIDNATVFQAGSFADSIVASHTNAHNVADLSSMSLTAGEEDDMHALQAPGGVLLTTQLKCAGTSGCHGSHDAKTSSYDGIQGFHHKSVADAGYKFLQIVAGNSGSGIAVDGANAPGANHTLIYGTETAANHPVYVAGATGISIFCNNCHDTFHGTATTETNSNSLWNRHPTDIALTSAMSAADVDVVNNPFAFTAIYATGLYGNANLTGYDATNGQVMCLSCHRAHGSNQPDILRFDYSTMEASGGATAGCLGCHVDQR